MTIKAPESFRLKRKNTTTKHRYIARTSDDMLRAITYAETLSSDGSLSRELLEINLGELGGIEAFVIDQTYTTPASKPKIIIKRRYQKVGVDVNLSEEIRKRYSPELIQQITELFAEQNPAARRLWECALSDS